MIEVFLFGLACGMAIVMVAAFISNRRSTGGTALTQLSDEERKSRRPLPPHILANALQDYVHLDPDTSTLSRRVRSERTAKTSGPVHIVTVPR